MRREIDTLRASVAVVRAATCDLYGLKRIVWPASRVRRPTRPGGQPTARLQRRPKAARRPPPTDLCRYR